MSPKFTTRIATAADREQIYRIRHAVYADELGQHASNAEGVLQDALDAVNSYIVVLRDDAVAAFIAITSPQSGAFSIDKYFSRAELPLRFHDALYELRLLTIREEYRHSIVLPLLIRATFDHLTALGATEAVAIGRREIVGLYEAIGFSRLGLSTQSGQVHYELMRIDGTGFQRNGAQLLSRSRKLQSHPRLDAKNPATDLATKAYHGGAFFEAIGPRFDALDAKDEVISADVLDAWFDPAPEAVAAIGQHLAFAMRTSPPTHAEGVLEVLAESRGLPEAHFALGAGSSDLMFRAMRLWLTPYSRVLLPDPTYGEYGHILEQVIGCQVQRFSLSPEDGYAFDIEALRAEFAKGFDWIFLVNPNSPTGTTLRRAELTTLLDALHPDTHLWLDETYVDYVDSTMTLEPLAAMHARVVVCKSLSKCYALSGLRAAYLCGSAARIAQVRQITPPWVLGLPTQMAVVAALRNRPYYEQQWAMTRQLRAELARMLEAIGIDIIGGQANFLLCSVRDKTLTAAALIARCREKKLYLRSLENFGARIDAYSFRIAVKDAHTNQRMVAIIADAMSDTGNGVAANGDVIGDW